VGTKVGKNGSGGEGWWQCKRWRRPASDNRVQCPHKGQRRGKQRKQKPGRKSRAFLSMMTTTEEEKTTVYNIYDEREKGRERATTCEGAKEGGIQGEDAGNNDS
jgi:hypothetical protein